MRVVRRISWVCYIVGISIVAASYLRLGPGWVGWAGWGVGMIGWGLQFVGRRGQRDG